MHDTIGPFLSSIGPTLDVLRPVLWLGTRRDDGTVVSVGSGVVLQVADRAYLATALHVANDCGLQPLIRFKGQWIAIGWTAVARDNGLDIAILKPENDRTRFALSRVALSRNDGGRIPLGSIGRALGFPVLVDPRDTSHISQVDGGLPIPFNVLISHYGSTENPRGVEYLGGYINSGFSGGAVVFPAYNDAGIGWKIMGIITHREGVLRERTDYDAKTNERKKYWHGEPSGIVRYVSIKKVFDMVKNERDA